MFTCSKCGREHDLEELSFGEERPVLWDSLSDAERAGSILTPAQCILRSTRGAHYLIRACLDIPVEGEESPFTWGVWVSLSEKSFQEVSEAWDSADRATLSPHFGWLCTPIPGYPDTMYLKTRVRQRLPGLRPLVELEPTDHPLAVHQRHGITMAELQTIVTPLLHKDQGSHAPSL